MRRPRIILLSLLVIGLSAAVVLVALFARERWHFNRLLHQARSSFESSRLGGTEDYAFVTRGVEAGMTVEQVKRLMAGAAEISHWVAPDWNGEVIWFRFKYGRPYANPFTGREDVLVREDYWVYFNPSGHATRMERVLFRRGGGGLVMEDIDLSAQNIVSHPYSAQH